jgi:hypothetical protein
MTSFQKARDKRLQSTKRLFVGRRDDQENVYFASRGEIIAVSRR